jgi:hypothetical protein
MGALARADEDDVVTLRAILDSKRLGHRASPATPNTINDLSQLRTRWIVFGQKTTLFASFFRNWPSIQASWQVVCRKSGKTAQARQDAPLPATGVTP